jgi:chromosome segregation ATPase
MTDKIEQKLLEESSTPVSNPEKIQQPKDMNSLDQILGDVELSQKVDQYLLTKHINKKENFIQYLQNQPKIQAVITKQLKQIENEPEKLEQRLNEIIVMAMKAKNKDLTMKEKDRQITQTDEQITQIDEQITQIDEYVAGLETQIAGLKEETTNIE